MENRKLIISKSKLVFNLFSSGYLKDVRLLKGFLDIELKEFLPEQIFQIWSKLMPRVRLYDDTPLVFYFNMEHQQSSRTISAPHMITIMLQQLDLKENDDLLILGAKSGYIAALAQVLSPKGKILILEANSKIAEITNENIQKIKLGEKIKVLVQNPLKGYPNSRPWQKILVTGAIKQERIYPLLNQLDPDEGVLFAPIGEGFDQTYTQIIRMGDKFFGKKHLKVRFTPLVTQIELDQLKLVTDFEEKSPQINNLPQSNSVGSISNISINYIEKILDDINLEPKVKRSDNIINLPILFDILYEYIEKSFIEEKKKYRLKLLFEILELITEDVLFEKQQLASYFDKIKGNELAFKEKRLIKARLEILDNLLKEINKFEKAINKDLRKS